MGINLTPKRRERLVRFLSQHVEEMRNRREVRCARIRDSVRRWEAKSKPSNYPWVGASSMHIPVVAAHGESILARILNSLKAQDRHLVVVAYNEDVQIGGLNDPITSKPLTWRWVAEALEDYLTWEMSPAGDVDWEEIETRIVLDTLQTGTGVLDTRWETLVERDYALDDPQTPLTRPMRDNVTFSVRPFEDFLTPPQYDSLDRVPIASILYRRRPSELRAKGVVLDWDSDVVEEIIEKSVGEIRISPVAAFLAATEEQGEGETYTTGDIEMLESWIRFDLDDSGYETRLLVDHALEDPGLILRVIPWPGPFPIDISRYIRRRYRLPGMSLAERLESLDEGISANLNQAINNGTISTARFWKVLKGSLAAKTWGRTRPGGKVVVESMDEIAPEQAGELYPSIFEIGNVLNAWAEKVSKINDYSLGRESQALGRQSTATSTLALLQETGTYHDSISREIRLCLNRAGQKWLDLLVQHKPLSRIAQVLGTERAAVLLQALELPEGDLRKRIGVRVAFSSTAATRELTRQEEAAKSQLLAEYYKSMTQLALLRVQSSVQARSGIPEAAFLVGLADAIASNAELHMSKLLDVYGDSFTTSSLPSWQKVLNDTGQAAGIASGIGGGAIPAGVGGGGGEGALLAPPAAGIGGAPGAMPFGPAQGGGGPFGAPPNGGAGGAIR